MRSGRRDFTGSRDAAEHCEPAGGPVFYSAEPAPPVGQTEASDYLVRLGPPAHGDVIHRASCRHAQKHANALRWVWADRQGFEHIDWGALRRHGLKACGVCDPEALR